MEFEHLRFSGFGPYATSQEVDFLALAGKGLFSVSGETGAGKTTIFDALTYALYGDVPGARQASSIRSDHAGPGDPTSVELVFVAANDRWRVVRSPDYQRTKARGRGLTTERAKAALYRWKGGGWEPLSTSKAEVDQQCRELVGLAKDQFERVGLLPQGEFRRLLHANSKERKNLFRTLFATTAIDDAVKKLLERAAAARAQAHDAALLRDDHGIDADLLAAELAELVMKEAPEHVVSLARTGQDPTADPEQRLRAVAQEAEVRLLPLLVHAEDTAAEAARAASNAVVLAQEQVGQMARLHELQRLRRHLDDRRAEVEAGAARAERAERARPVIHAHRRLAGDLDRRHTADQAADAARSEVVESLFAAGLVFDPTESLDPQRTRLERRIQQMGDLAELAAERTAVEKTIASVDGELADRRSHRDRTILRRDELTELLVHARRQVEGSATAATELAGLRSGLELLAEIVRHADVRDEASDHIDAFSEQLRALDDEMTALREEQQLVSAEIAGTQPLAEQAGVCAAALDRCRQRLEELEKAQALAHELASAEQTLDETSAALHEATRIYALGVAPRLAGQLLDGQPCAVCGSCEHPAPATFDPETAEIDEDGLRAATALRDDALTTVAGLRRALELQPPNDARMTKEQAGNVMREAAHAWERSVLAKENIGILVERLEQINLTLQDRATRRLRSEGERDARIAVRSAAIASLAEHGETETVELRARLAGRRAELDRSKELAERRHVHETTLAEIDAELADLVTALAEVDAEIGAAEASRMARAEQLESMSEKLAALEGRDPVDTLARLARAARSLISLEKAVGELARVDAEVQRSRVDLEVGLQTAQFPTLAEALEAELTEEDATHFRDLHEAFVTQTLECEAGLRQLAELRIPEVAPDLDALARDAEAKAATARAATEKRLTVQSSVTRANDMVDNLVVRMSDLRHLEAEADRHEQIANLCNARGASRIGLEGFVLRGYLHHVVHQANLRLQSLSGGRYQLILATEALDGRGEWGLDLTVSDAHTGEQRAVTSLSGGETFYTSLSLALGLSDVLSNRGAASINSVFIDEGFGSLDSSVIDLTIDVLSQLGADGVTVGVITHVDAVRDALPAGLIVEKLPTGDSRVVQPA